MGEGLRARWIFLALGPLCPGLVVICRAPRRLQSKAAQQSKNTYLQETFVFLLCVFWEFFLLSEQLWCVLTSFLGLPASFAPLR